MKKHGAISHVRTHTSQRSTIVVLKLEIIDARNAEPRLLRMKLCQSKHPKETKQSNRTFASKALHITCNEQLKALKITGPNGNHIIILPTIHNTGIGYWTATQSVNYKGRAERFSVKIAECKDEDDSLWLTTPFDKNKAIIMRHMHMEWEARIRPVADKKWKGKL